ncbi:MAG: type II secretion system major pseudopilin GspG [Planctomycetota bacterium]
MNTRIANHSVPHRREAGFTLIEIMVVVVILGLLASMVATNAFQHAKEAKIEIARTSVTTIEGAVEMYVLEVGRFPQSLQDLTARDVKGGPYLKSIDKDPWGSDFQLRGDDKDFEVLSCGPDRNEGSEDDISSKKKE